MQDFASGIVADVEFKEHVLVLHEVSSRLLVSGAYTPQDK